MSLANSHYRSNSDFVPEEVQKFNDLVDHATDELEHNLVSARDLCEEALQFAKDCSYAEGVIIARLKLEACRMSEGDNTKARENLLVLLDETGDRFPYLSADILNRIGTTYFLQTDYSKALSSYLRAMKIYEESADFDKQVRTLINIAIIHTYREEFELVEDYLNRCLKILKTTLEKTDHGKLLNQFGILFLHNNDLEKALSCFKRAAEIFGEDNNINGKVECLSNIAIIYREKGDTDEAVRITKEVLSIWDEQGNARGKAICLKNLASNSWRNQEYSEAIRYLNEMLAIGRELSNRHLVYEALKSLADVQGHIGEYEQAYKNLMEFITVFTEVHNEEDEREMIELTAKYDVEKNQREAEIHRLRNVELAKAQQLARLGSWEWDIDSQVFECSKEFYHLLGFDPDKDQIQPEAILTLVRPENKDESIKAVKEMLHEHKNLDIVVSVIRKDGVERFMNVQGEHRARKDGYGKPSIFGTVQDITDQKNAQAEREKLIAELQEALSSVKVLRGLLPICAHCKKIRDDQGYWNQLESYISEKSDAQFTHGICPECLKQHYSGFETDED